MPENILLEIENNTSYKGPVAHSYKFQVLKGYSSLVGINDAGKSSFLVFIFWATFRIYSPEELCILRKNREFIGESAEVGDFKLSSYNQRLYDVINNGQSFAMKASNDDISQTSLAQGLMKHHGYRSQTETLNSYLKEFGLPEAEEVEGKWDFGKVLLQLHGSGVRSLFFILAALSDLKLKLLIIDEPEQSLEPALQKKLKTLLSKRASEGLTIVTATHSVHFLADGQDEHLYKISKHDDNRLTTDIITNDSDKSDIVFKLLGNSLTDLFFPGNFLIIEGASDEMICKKIVELLGYEDKKIRTVAAESAVKIKKMSEAIESNLRPLVINKSPYAERLVILLDKPNDDNGLQRLSDELKDKYLDRFFQLSETSLEEYLPSSLYDRAGIDKAVILADISNANASGNYKKLAEIKQEVANKISEILKLEDLTLIPTIKEAVEKSAFLAS
jgi:ABC-type phosphate transport system ATPase subunit